MAQRQSRLTLSSGDFGRAAVQDLAVLALVAAAALALALAVRPIASYDVGYHLAYGENFLDTGRIVQTNQFIYTRLDRDIAPGSGDLGPGCRYDAATNTYRFVNANWLSQVIMAGVNRLGGMVGLSLLQAALVAGIFAVLAVAMRRGRVGCHWIAPAVILMAMTSYERFDLRPEVFGYLMLVGQLALLLSPRFGRGRAAGVVALQLLAVNLHSYFLLGVALTGAILLDGLLRWLWAKSVTRADPGELSGRLKWLGAAFAGVVLASLCNPWHVRGAVMPIQTVLYLRQHHILGASLTADSHPWAFIGEFVPALEEGLRGLRATSAYVVVLIVGCAGLVAALARRRWGWALVLIGIGAVSFLTRRNIALGAMVMVPVSAILLTEAWRRLSQARPPGGRRRFARPAVAALALSSTALAAWWTVSVVTNRFYFSQRRSWRFGLGASKLMIPLEAAEWINQHDPAGNVWCDFADSSNLMYLTRRPVPILTNTWAYPPSLMRRVMQITAAAPDAPLEPVAAEYDVGTVVLRYSQLVPPLIGVLARSPDWSVVQVGAKHVVFLRSKGPTAALAREQGLSEEGLDLAEFIGRLRRADPVSAYALHSAAILLSSMGWTRTAAAAWQECIDQEPEYPEALFGLAGTLAAQGSVQARLARHYLGENDPRRAGFARERARESWQRAERLLERLLRLRADYPNARRYLEQVRASLARLDQPPAPPP